MRWFDIDEYGPDFVPVQCVGSGDEGKRGRDHFSRYLHSLEGNLEGQSAIVEQAKVIGLEMAAKCPGVLLQHRTIVGEPSVAPDRLQPFLELLQRREEWSGYVDGLLKRRRHAIRF